MKALSKPTTLSPPGCRFFMRMTCMSRLFCLTRSRLRYMRAASQQSACFPACMRKAGECGHKHLPIQYQPLTQLNFEHRQICSTQWLAVMEFFISCLMGPHQRHDLPKQAGHLERQTQQQYALEFFPPVPWL